VCEIEDLQDSAAMKYKWDVKGYAGLKACMLCTNIVKKGHVAAAAHPELKDLADLKPGEFIESTDA
jgi:hypothetical protein